MAVEIKYNGVNPFGTRTPFVSREFIRQDVNGYISGVTRLTLSGTRPRPNSLVYPIVDFADDLIADSDGDSIVGGILNPCESTFIDYTIDFDLVKSYFAQQFKTFEILEDSGQIFYHSAANE